jgi:predicted nucleic acid-binding protein
LTTHWRGKKSIERRIDAVVIERKSRSGPIDTNVLASPHYLIETDVLAEWLVASPEEPVVLDGALRTGRCYTSMLNATELLAACRSDSERHAVEALFRIVRVLGFPARSATTYAEIARTIEMQSGCAVTTREMMVIGLATESKLTVLTHARYDRYRALNSVQVVSSVTSAHAIEVK